MFRETHIWPLTRFLMSIC